MALKNYLLILMMYVAMIFFACNKPVKRNNEIDKIEIATGSCLRRCPVVGLIIDSTLNMQYYGGYRAKLQGYHYGKVTQGFWDTLNVKLRQIDFKKLDTSFIRLPLDAESAEAIVYQGANKRHVFVPIEGNTGPAASVFTWIINSYRSIKLQKLNSKVKFETTFQFMMPPTPKAPADQVIFPPPKKK